MRKPTLHPACKLFPPLAESELQELADDIVANGLRNPIVLYQGKLLDGRNRWEACKIAKVKPRLIEFEGNDPIAWVLSQNLTRRHLTASQRAVVALDLLPMLEKEAKKRQQHSNGYRKDRQSAKEFADLPAGKASEMAARLTKSNSRYVEKVKSISKEAPELIERIRSGELNVSEAQRLATIGQQRSNEQKARQRLGKKKTWNITSNQKVIQCDLLIADPPYGITNEPWEPKNLKTYTQKWCRKWTKCEADFITIFWSQKKLFEGRQWFDESLKGYRFQQLLVWHANNNTAPKSRMWLKQTWEPIFLYRRLDSKRQIISTNKTWDSERHNGDCFVGAIPQTVYNGADYRQHPCQKPVSVMRWLIHALSDPGETVGSLYCGVAPCGIAASQLGRRYHGIETDKKYRQLAEERIATYGTEVVEINGGKRSRLKHKT